MRKRWRDFAGSHPDIDCELWHPLSLSAPLQLHHALIPPTVTHTGFFFADLQNCAQEHSLNTHAGACLKNRSRPGKPDNECFFLSCREELSFQGETIMKKFSYRYLIYRPSVIYSSPIISLIANRYQYQAWHADTHAHSKQTAYAHAHGVPSRTPDRYIRIRLKRTNV